MPIPLLCVGFSLIGLTDLEGPSLVILAVNIPLVALLILLDEIMLRRNHRLGLLRSLAAESRRRIEELGIESEQIDRFVASLWSDHELALNFKRTRLRSVELVIQALDSLSRIAARYGRCGKRVFEANEDPIVGAMRLMECIPYADAERMLPGLLKRWLEGPPEFDPEGWALLGR
jgi:hypothetical protein